ncbi:MAG: hypothetical protein CL940_06370 [Deltaproteobacteria bacterium]|nr:hypothetical protein [Deltaproteobacteria bacterium]
MSSVWILLATLLTLSSPAGTADTLLEDERGQVGAGLEPLHHTRTDWNPDSITYLFQSREGASVALRLVHPRGSVGEPVAGRYRAEIVVKPDSARATLAPAVDRVMARLTARARLGPELRAPRAATSSGEGPGEERRGEGASHRVVEGAQSTAQLEFWLCALLLLLAVGTLPALVSATREGLGAAPGEGRWLLALCAAVALVQWLFVPQTLVGVFSGYASVSDALALEPVTKYGAFTTVLYGPWLRALGPSTDVICTLNVLLGLGLVPLAGAWASRLSGTRRAGWIAIMLVGLAPALMRDRASESVLVPVQFALLAAGVHLDRWLESSSKPQLIGAVAWAALALHGRPEAWVVAPVLAIAWLALDGRWSRLKTGVGALAAVVLLAVIAPRLWSLLHYMESASAHGDVPGLAGGGDLEGIWERLLHLNLLLSTELHAVSGTVLAIVAWFVVRRARLLSALSLGLAVALWVGLSTLDLPAVSVPRVQAPALVWLMILVAIALGCLAQGPERWRRGLALVGLALVLIPRPAVIDTLWVETNAQSFDQWWDRAKAALPEPERELCVVALSMSDPPSDVVLRHLPLYELPGMDPGRSSLSISTFLETPASVLASDCDPIYIEGPQCYARSFDPDGPRPERADRLPICQRMHREWALSPLQVEDITNKGNPDFPFYGGSETLRYGLYRIVHLDPTNTGPRKVTR